MRKFLIRTIIVIAAVFFLYQFTIGSEISNLKNTLTSFSDKGKREMIKEKLKDEMKKGIQKENYFDEEEKVLISKFLKKILKELDLINDNN
tara:strand:- start:225 stop:497 length:273 start_codon:yes stop_codon:yes gene_type:complete